MHSIQKNLYQELLVIASFVMPLLLYAEDHKYHNYSWEENRTLNELTPAEENEPAIFMKHLQVHEYIYRENDVDLELYSTVHKIIRVNNDDGVQAYNKIFIPMSDVIEILAIQARSINRNGVSVELDQNNIKEITGDEGGSGYKIFAVEGVEVGGEIEYWYTRKLHPTYFGRNYFQFKIPSKKVDFELISPENLIFSTKGYSNFPEIIDTTFNGKRYLNAHSDFIPALTKEEFSYFNPNRMRVEYKLSYNQARGGSRLLTFSDATQRIFNNIYDLSKEEKKQIEKFYKSIKISSKKNNEEKIRMIENFVKTNFSIQEAYSRGNGNIVEILNNKYGSKKEMARLFAALFKEADIKHQLVLTTERDDVKFDRYFDSWNYLVNYIFYFPETDSYLTPERFEYRYGMIPFHLTHNYGLFIEPVNIGDFESGIGKINFIPALDYTKNFDNLRVEVDLDLEGEKASISIDREIGGYSAVNIQPYYTFLSENRKREVIERYIKFIINDAEFKNLNVENTDRNLSPLTSPFIINSTVESSAILERAGNKFLLKLGELIGPQLELYQENERVTAVENDFNRLYDRRIKVKIPSNYKIKNPESIKMLVSHVQEGEDIYLFQSDYSLEDGTLTVQIDEYYKQIDCSIENFEAFREVINAAADFNKVTLVLEPLI